MILDRRPHVEGELGGGIPGQGAEQLAAATLQGMIGIEVVHRLHRLTAHAGADQHAPRGRETRGVLQFEFVTLAVGVHVDRHQRRRAPDPAGAYAL